MSEILTHLGAWTAVPNQVLLDSQLSKSARLVYCILLSHARPGKGKMTVWPGVTRLSEETGFSESTVKDALGELARQEKHRSPLIERQRRMGQSSITIMLNPLDAYTGLRKDPASGSGLAIARVTGCIGEEDVVEEDKVTACVPSPRTTVVEEINPDYMTKKELARRERDEVLGKHKPPEEKKAPLRARTGRELADFWDIEVTPRCSVPRVASYSIKSLCAAGRTFEALRDTKWREYLTGDVIFKVIDEIKACDPRVRKTITFEMLFVSKAENLPKLLNGNWRASKGVASETAGWGKDIL